MSAFPLQPDSSRPANKLEFVSQTEAAILLGVDPRTVRRYLRDPQVREILGAVCHLGRWQLPRSSFEAPWRIGAMREQLASIGKGRDNSFGSIIRRESGMGNPRLEREAKILRLALEIERRSRKGRLTQRAKREIEKIPARARSFASKYRRSVFEAPKFYERWLTAQNDKEKKRNAPKIKWLKKHGIWNCASPKYAEWLKDQGFCASAKELINSGEDYSEFQGDTGATRKLHFSKGSGYFDAVIGYQDANGRMHNFLLPNSFTEGKSLRVTCLECHSIDLSPVKTKAQITREVRTLQKRWPSQKSIEAAKQKYDRNWQLLDLARATAKCKRQKKPTTPGNLCKYLHLDEIAEWRGSVGISRSTFFRRYTKRDLNLLNDSKATDDYRLQDLRGNHLTIINSRGWEVGNTSYQKEL